LFEKLPVPTAMLFMVPFSVCNVVIDDDNWMGDKSVIVLSRCEFKNMSLN